MSLSVMIAQWSQYSADAIGLLLFVFVVVFLFCLVFRVFLINIFDTNMTVKRKSSCYCNSATTT